MRYFKVIICLKLMLKRLKRDLTINIRYLSISEQKLLVLLLCKLQVNHFCLYNLVSITLHDFPERNQMSKMALTSLATRLVGHIDI